ncbi:MAG: cytochrome c biogenesis protein CcsA [Bacteroidota bacterium]|nr:cytochrome c biogenesis protein CcsA [Bacteroidota bacterium]
MAKNWWKILAVLIVMYTIVAGFLLPVPRLDILNETIRSLYFHVPIWFAMLFLMGVSVYSSIMYLGSNKAKQDIVAVESANTGIAFSVLGILTGMLWARYTWGTWWTTDTKLNGVAITFLIYTAYFILRSSIEDEQKKARISAIYNIFAFVMMIVFIMILPRMSASLHPGNGGNPAFGKFDLDNTMRLVFYPACIAWIMIGCWIAQLRIRMEVLSKKILYDETV